MSVKVTDSRISVETPTLVATLEIGFLTSLRNRETGQECLGPVDVKAGAALQLIYPGNESVRVDASKFGKITARQISPHAPSSSVTAGTETAS